jgi:hypothetical protein
MPMCWRCGVKPARKNVEGVPCRGCSDYIIVEYNRRREKTGRLLFLDDFDSKNDVSAQRHRACSSGERQSGVQLGEVSRASIGRDEGSSEDVQDSGVHKEVAPNDVPQGNVSGSFTSWWEETSKHI